MSLAFISSYIYFGFRTKLSFSARFWLKIDVSMQIVHVPLRPEWAGVRTDKEHRRDETNMFNFIRFWATSTRTQELFGIPLGEGLPQTLLFQTLCFQRKLTTAFSRELNPPGCGIVFGFQFTLGVSEQRSWNRRNPPLPATPYSTPSQCSLNIHRQIEHVCYSLAKNLNILDD